jgi:hypothetical protein
MNLDNIKGNDNVKNHLKNCIAVSNFEHLILYGRENSGKSYMIKCFFEDYYQNECIKSYVYELNILNDRGIKTIRNELKRFCITKSFDDKLFKFVLIPKAEFLNYDSLCALRRTIEIFSKKVRFIFLCSKLNTIIPAILSRCILLRTTTSLLKDDVIFQQNNVKIAKFEYLNEAFRKNKIKKNELYHFMCGVDKIQYDYIEKLCTSNTTKSYSEIKKQFYYITKTHQIPNEVLINCCVMILDKEKYINRLVHLSEIMYLNYQSVIHQNIITLNILNVLNLIKN